MKNDISFLYILIKKINSLIDNYVFINHIHLGSRCHGTIPLITQNKKKQNLSININLTLLKNNK